MTWPAFFELNPDSREPLFLQIARGISAGIRNGRFAAGARLPGSRSLARALSVHRNTVVEAYAELEAQGWVVSEPARGVFVSRQIPEPLPGALLHGSRYSDDRVGFALAPLLPPAMSPLPNCQLPLLGGIPDLKFVPLPALWRAYRRALMQQGGSLLNYADPRGHPQLRGALCQMLALTRAIPATPEQVFVTRGSQMALYLAARAALPPGSTIAVERWGYPPAWQAFRLAGARLAPVRVDAHGLDVDALRRLLDTRRIAAVYVTPHHQFPTTVTLPPARRLALMQLAAQHRFAIIEDDYDHEFHYDGRPMLPLASSDNQGVVLYVGTLSKILAPGLRTGFLVASEPVLQRVERLRASVDRQGDQICEAALATLLEDGDVERHARKAQRLYRERRDTLCGELRDKLGSLLEFNVPSGGMALWCRAHGVDVEDWATRSQERGVQFMTGRHYAFRQRSRPFIRLGFAGLEPGQLHKAVELMVRALPNRCGVRNG